MGLSDHGDPPRRARAEAADRHRALAVHSRRALLAVLRDHDGELDAAELADEVGLHVSTARQHLEVLAESGVVSRRVERRTTRGRPRVLYAATSRRDPDDGDGLMAMLLATHLAQGEDPVGEAERAGRRWGRALGQRASVRAAGAPPSEVPDVAAATRCIVDLLDEVGFDPKAHPGAQGTVVDLGRCPFLQVARTHPEVACSVHLGLMRGALEALGSPLRADTLEPFVTPTLCRAHLLLRDAAATREAPATS